MAKSGQISSELVHNPTEIVRSEFLLDPGMISSSFFLLKVTTDKEGLSRMIWILLFHIEHALTTKLFFDISRLNFGNFILL